MQKIIFGNGDVFVVARKNKITLLKACDDSFKPGDSMPDHYNVELVDDMIEKDHPDILAHIVFENIESAEVLAKAIRTVCLNICLDNT